MIPGVSCGHHSGGGASLGVVQNRSEFAPSSPPEEFSMAKPHRSLKKANHGSRPANSKARKAKRKHIKT